MDIGCKNSATCCRYSRGAICASGKFPELGYYTNGRFYLQSLRIRAGNFPDPVLFQQNSSFISGGDRLEANSDRLKEVDLTVKKNYRICI